MGKRISYFIPQSEISLFELVASEFDAFRDWYLQTDHESFQDFGEHLSTSDFISLLEGRDSFDEILSVGQVHTDLVVLEFVGTYCDYGPGANLVRSVGPDMSTWRYDGSTALVRKHLDEASSQLWNYLLDGRSLMGDRPFTENEDQYRIGFWKANEVVYFQNQVLRVFGSPDQIQEKFWTRREKKAYRNAREDSGGDNFSIANHNPVSSGIEYVQQAINEMKGIASDLIFFTER